MTIIYQYRVATTSLGGFFKLLLIWKGSVYKLMFKEMMIFGTLYAAISMIYRLALTPEQRQTFEKIAMYFNSYTSLIPVSFVLGFYIFLVVHRWWQQFQNIPWPDRTLFMANCYIRGTDEKGRIIRRTIARYMLFGFILIARSVSVAVMKRYPTMDHIVQAGFITHGELSEYESVECKYNKFWVPLMWANSVLAEARKEERLESDFGLQLLIEQLSDFRDKCSLCFVYDWITIPLVYTQVVTLAVYSFFAACLIGRQFLDPKQNYEGYEYDLFVPVFTFLQFFFYMGWLKVAEQLINPFGEDDDDYDINWLIDRHMAVSMCLADQCHGKHPPLTRDLHFDDVVSELPYTEASLSSRRPIFLGSTFNLARPSYNDQQIVDTDILADHQKTRTHSFASTFGGSRWSLFSRTSKVHHFLGSHDGLSPKLPHRLPMSNGNLDYIPVPHTTIDNSGKMRSVSFDASAMLAPVDNQLSNISNNYVAPDYVPLRRAQEHVDVDQRDHVYRSDRKRKISFPLSLLHRNNQSDSDLQEQIQHSPSGLRRNNRFHVHHVPGTPETEVTKRNAQIVEKILTGKIVSRAPELSDIAEQNTLTSLVQLDTSEIAVEKKPEIRTESNDEVIQEEEDNEDV